MNRFEFAVTGMHCPSCGMLIDDAVEDLPGVIRSHTDMRTERTVVEVEGNGTGVEQLTEAIVAAGYGLRVLG